MIRWLQAGLDRQALIIAAIAFITYLPGFWWGTPTATAADRVQAWGVDDSAPVGPLAEVHNIVEPRSDRNLGYPLLHDFLVAAAYAPYLLLLLATGRMHGIRGVYPFGMTDPVGPLRVLTLINHAVTVVMGVIVVVAAYDIGRSLWDRRAGTFAAIFTLMLYPMFYYGRTGNVDVPMLAFIALALAALARGIAGGMTTGRAVWTGIWSGCALATKEAAVGALLPAALIVLVLGWRAGGWRVPAAALLASVLALGLGSGLFIEPSRWIAHVRFISGRASDVPQATTLTSAFPFTAAGNFGLARAMLAKLVDTMSLPGLLLGVGGAIAALLRDRRAALIALVAPVFLLFTFLTLRTVQLRYVLPGAFVLAIFAGWALASARDLRPSALGGGVILAAIVALVIQSANGLSLTYEMLKDSRYAAGQWLAGRVHAGDTVDFFGATQKLPPMPAGVITKRATPWRGMWAVHRADSGVAEEIRRHWQASHPPAVVVIPDHSTRGDVPYDASVPPMLFESLLQGRETYRLGAFFQTPPLIAALPRPPLDYPSVNPPIRIFVPADRLTACMTPCD